MNIDELLAELKEYGIENKFESVLLHSTKIKLMMNTIENQQQENDHLRDMLKRSRNNSRDRRKEVKLLQASNRKHKQKIKQLECLHPHFMRDWKSDGRKDELFCKECDLVLVKTERTFPIK